MPTSTTQKSHLKRHLMMNNHQNLKPLLPTMIILNKKKKRKHRPKLVNNRNIGCLLSRIFGKNASKPSFRLNSGRKIESNQYLFNIFNRNKCQLIGKVLISMISNIMHRMAAAVIENETFTR